MLSLSVRSAIMDFVRDKPQGTRAELIVALRAKGHAVDDQDEKVVALLDDFHKNERKRRGGP